MIQKRVVLLGTCDGYPAIKRTSHNNPGLSLPGSNDAYIDPKINIQLSSKTINHSDLEGFNRHKNTFGPYDIYTVLHKH